MEKSFIYTENMTVGYDGKALIRDIRLSLEKGQILTLIGPNGAGKSTILKSIIRQLKLVDGAVFLDQKSMEKMTDKEISRKLAVVMTGRMQPELMTCEESFWPGPSVRSRRSSFWTSRLLSWISATSWNFSLF